MKINRRNFLFSTLLLSSNCSKVLSKNISKSAKIVIVGAGWGGLSAAKTLRFLNPNYDISLIEKKNHFISCPISNWVIGQIKQMKDITFSYKKFVKNNNINLIKKHVTYIDKYKKRVYFNKEYILYDILILSPGIAFEYNTIKGMKKDLGDSVFTSWKSGVQTKFFSNAIRKLESNQNIILSVPLSPYRCPPGPYERVSLIANYIKNKALRSKIIVLDANQKIVSKGKLFSQAWKDLYEDIIEYIPDSQVVELNTNEKKVYTEFDEYKFEIANIIPPQKASELLHKSELIEKGRKWAKVNPFDFSSKLAKDIYVIGDSTDASSIGRIPKSGYIAYSMGKVCGYAVHHSLKGLPPPSPSMINTCYSLVSHNEGISVSAVYKYDKSKNKIVSIKGATGLSPNRSEWIAEDAWSWAKSIWYDMLS